VGLGQFYNVDQISLDEKLFVFPVECILPDSFAGFPVCSKKNQTPKRF
jgi:hypothetical protein